MSFVAVAIGGAAALGAGAGLIGSKMSSDAAGNAASQQANAANRATDLQQQMYNQQRSDNEPWRAAGVTALSGLGNADFSRDFTATDFTKDPGYDFRMQEGQKALERSAAAKGGLQSGGAMKAISRYGQDYASNEYQNAYNRFNADRDRRFGRLSSIAGVGQTATGALGQAGQNFAGQAGSNMMGAANASGAAGLAGAKAWGNGIAGAANAAGGAAGNWMTMSMMNQKNPMGASSGPLMAGEGYGTLSGLA